jgi:secreted Zn-dependent insulinase-like peptidase
MTPSNVYVSTVYPEAKTDKVTYHYQVPYGVKSLSTDLIDLPASLKDQYHLPKKNIFVPASSQLFPADKALSRPTKITLNNPRSILWVKQDVSFSVPKASINLRVQSPLAASSLRDGAMSQLLIAMMNDSLNENSYPALIAGLSYSLSANSRGFDIRLEGYDDKMSALLDMVINQVASPVFSQERFENVKTNLIRHLGNTQQLTPYRQLFKVLPTTLYSPYYADQALMEALADVSYSELKLFAKHWLKGANLEGLFYGNINAERVNDWKQSLANVVSSNDQVVEPAQVVKLSAKTTKEKSARLENRFPVDHNDKAVALYIQGVNDTLNDNAKMMLLRQILESNFYSQLRTEQQLGYIVFLTNMSFKDVPGSVFIVQSPTASSVEIKKAINKFLEESMASIPNDLTGDQRSLATKLLEKPQTLSQKSGRYWSSILKKDDRFSYRERLVDAINAVDAEQLRQYYQQVLLTPSSSIWFVAEKSIEPSVLSFPKEQLYYQYP